MESKGVELSLVKQALLEIEALRKEVAQLKKVDGEHFAIVGMSCRLPGGIASPDELWQMVVNQQCVISTPPKTRVFMINGVDCSISNPDVFSEMRGGYVADPYGMDHHFFGISQRELLSLDPQQRHLLELTWEAFENAGIDPQGLRDSNTSVFVGITSNDFGHLLQKRGEKKDFDAYFVTGNVLNTAAGRISHTFGFRGPSLSLDTACSSSLSALHLGINSLRNKESNLAVVSGINLIFSPIVTQALQTSNVISVSGHCKPFDASADGYVRSEGGGVIIIKRLSDALESNDRIFAVVRGSSINHVGPSAGLTVPSEVSQVALVKQALLSAGVAASDIDYVETHGTGTVLGDPIEVNALGTTLCEGRTADNALVIGSVKANIGHLESAAGIASLIKVVLALQHRKLPPQANFTTPNPHIRWDQFPITVPVQPMPWPEKGHKRLAGVSGFGFGGTNAHVILEEAPSLKNDMPATAFRHSRHLLALSAGSAASLNMLQRKYADHLLSHPELTLDALCFSANTGRAQLEYRSVFIADDRDSLLMELQATTTPASPADMPPQIAFLFTGQGAQRIGMGRELYAFQPVFREIIDQCDALIQAQADWSLKALLHDDANTSARLHQTVYTQPALFAVEYALARMWMSWGITPCALLGHSVGEYVAACVAGVYNLSDGLSLVLSRGQLMQALPAGGAMAAVRAGEPVVRHVTDACGDAVSIAALNGPGQVVISGEAAAVADCLQIFATQGISAAPLEVSHAFHSALLEPMLTAFYAVADRINYTAPSIPLISNVTGQVLGGDEINAAYWCRHARQPVEFARGLATLTTLGCDTYMEVGPQPVLLGLAAGQLPEGTRCLASLHGHKGEWQQVLSTLGTLYAAGMPVDWTAFYHGYAQHRVELPTYAWARQSALFVSGNVRQQRFTRSDFKDQRRVTYQKTLVAGKDPYLDHHRIFGHIVVAGAMHVAMLITVASDYYEGGPFVLKDIVFLQPLRFNDTEQRDIQITINIDDKNIGHYAIASRRSGNPRDDWLLHLEAYSEGSPSGENNAHHQPSFFAKRLPELENRFEQRLFYKDFRLRGYELGQEYCWLQQGTFNGTECICTLADPLARVITKEYDIAPGLIDSCFQTLAVSLTTNMSMLDRGDIYIPFNIKQIAVYKTDITSSNLIVSGIVEARELRDNCIYGSVHLEDSQGETILDIQGFAAKKAEAFVPDEHEPTVTPLLWQYLWQRGEVDILPGGAPDTWIIFSDMGGVGQSLTDALQERHAECVLLNNHPQVLDTLDSKTCFDINQLTTLISSLSAQSKKIGIAYLWGLDEKETGGNWSWKEHTMQLCSPLLAIVRACSENENSAAIKKMVVVTCGAQTVHGDQPAPLLLQSVLSGMARVVANELPFVPTLLADLDPTDALSDIDTLAQCMTTSAAKDEIAFRERELHVPSLVPITPQKRLPHVDISGQKATYLITGGLGALGMLTARVLIEQGADCLVLLGRSEADERKEAALATLRNQGAVTVSYICSDVSDATSLQGVIDYISRYLPPLRGIVHAAGVNDDVFLMKESWEHFWQVAQAKIDGSWNLHNASIGHPIDFFILYSSIASIFGPVGQSAYAAGNAFLDALVYHRVKNGLPATSINWGGWSETGMMANVRSRDIERMHQAGIGQLTQQQGMAVMREMTSIGRIQSLVVPLDLNKIKNTVQRQDLPIIIKRMRFPDGLQQATAVSVSSHPGRVKKSLEPSQTKSYLYELVSSILLDDIGEDLQNKSLVALGLDSMMALEIKMRIKDEVGVDIPILKLLDGATMSSLIAQVKSHLFLDQKKSSTNPQELTANHHMRIEL
jgi:acyl transferase domain-containing protein/acyl carrier protein/short-subunit dehydrogenase